MGTYYEEVTVKNALACMALFMKDDEDLTCGDIQGLMEKMKPAADVIEVVRCKDCVYHQHGSSHPLWCNAWCSENDSYWMNKVIDDGYCYRGKRKEGQR